VVVLCGDDDDDADPELLPLLLPLLLPAGDGDWLGSGMLYVVPPQLLLLDWHTPW
jgi:hypothetical protein